MTAPTDRLAALIAGLESAANAAEQAEASFKRDIDLRIAELERARAFAFRRLRLIGAMAAPAEGEREAAVEARLDAAMRHIGWLVPGAELDPTELEVRAALEPVAAALEDLARPPEGEGEPPSAADALVRFEAWYRARFGAEFLDVFEQRAEFRSLVDF
ncbi:hypothetical protein [Desertibaculum subflavum]|uniref:hypothetical protein n=1 Tax=Desertibaculum subflavum TaxID=2268458 RepID=UPI000E66C4D1